MSIMSAPSGTIGTRQGAPLSVAMRGAATDGDPRTANADEVVCALEQTDRPLKRKGRLFVVA